MHEAKGVASCFLFLEFNAVLRTVFVHVYTTDSILS